MARALEYEVDAMVLAANDLVSSGYKVISLPSPSELPEELRGMRPDGIAIGKKPYLVIEVAREGRDIEKTNKIRRALEGNQDWKLHVVFDRGETSSPLGTETLGGIENLLADIPKVAKDDSRAALLMCWSCLEALARIVEPSDFARPQTPGRVIERLASLSYIAPSEAAVLRSLVSKRNEFIHGMISVSVSERDIYQFLALLNDLVGAARKAQS